jgi:AAA+ ATPase superfamily predicted ATPase
VFDTLFIMISKEMIVKITKKHLKEVIKEVIKEAWEDLPAEYRKKYTGMAPEKQLDWFGSEEPALTPEEYMNLENVEQELLQYARTLYPSEHSREQRDLLELDIEKEIEILAKTVVEEPTLMDMAKEKVELAVIAVPAMDRLSGTEYV